MRRAAGVAMMNLRKAWASSSVGTCVSKRNPHTARRLPIYEVHIIVRRDQPRRKKQVSQSGPHDGPENHSVKQRLLIVEDKINPGKTELQH